MILRYEFYVWDHNTQSNYSFYGIREELAEAISLEKFLTDVKGYNSFHIETVKTDEWTPPIKKLYFDKPLMLINEIAKHVIPDEINDLTTAQYAFYEGHITFKEYNKIVKRIKEGTKWKN